MEYLKQPSGNNSHQHLDRIKDIASEHFDEYLLVVTKGGQVYNTYKSKCAAHGMASMVLQDIHNSWNVKEDISEQ